MSGEKKARRAKPKLRQCPQCDTQVVNLKRHIRTVHDNDRPFPCLFPECTAEPFGANSSLQEHIRNVHEGGGSFECVFPGCTASPLKSQSSLNRHVRQVHGDSGPFPCDFPNCPSKPFKVKSSLQRHVRIAHRISPFKCPDCGKGCQSQSELDQHWNINHAESPLRFPCGICKRQLRSPGIRREHERRHTHWKCPVRFCEMLFETAEEALMHAVDPDHGSDKVFYACPLPNCRLTAAGKVFWRTINLKQHWQTHLNKGHVSPGTILEYSRGKLPPFSRNPLIDAIFGYRPQIDIVMTAPGDVADPDGIENQATEHDGNNQVGSEEEEEEDDEGDSSTEDEPMKDVSMEEDSHIDFSPVDESMKDVFMEDDNERDSSTEYDPMEDDFMEDDFMENDYGEEGDDSFLEGDIDILKKNREIWEIFRDTLPICLWARGFTCIGSDLKSKHFVQEQCSEQVTTDLDTAFLRQVRRGDKSRLILETRCLRCRANWRIKQLNARFEFSPKQLGVDFSLYRQQFLEAASKPWVLYHIDYETRVRQPVIRIRHHPGKPPAARELVVFDCEWTMPGQKLCEVAIIDRATNKVLINTLIKRSNPVEATPLSNGPLEYHPRLQHIAKNHEKRIYSNADESNQMDVHQVAQVLRQEGITPKTVFIAWHNNRIDLKKLREFLEQGGYAGILPQDDNCIPMVSYFRRNMPKELSASLPIIFEALYPGHKLIGHNHRALPDTQQAMLLLDAFDQLCKPSEKRNKRWRIETLRDLYMPDDGSHQDAQEDVQQGPSVSAKRKVSLTDQSVEPSRPKRGRPSYKSRL